MSTHRTYRISYQILMNNNGDYVHRHDCYKSGYYNIQDYLKWLKTSSIPNIYDHALRNVNFLSYAYISRHSWFKGTKNNSSCVSSDYLEEVNPDIIDELAKSEIVVIAYMLTFPDNKHEYSKDGKDMLEVIDTRVRDHDIAQKLIEKYNSTHHTELAPICYTDEFATYWIVKHIKDYSQEAIENYINSTYAQNLIDMDINDFKLLKETASYIRKVLSILDSMGVDKDIYDKFYDIFEYVFMYKITDEDELKSKMKDILESSTMTTIEL